MKTYIGVDLHYNQLTYHMIRKDSEGKISRENGTIPTEIIDAKFPNLSCGETYVCVEATSTTYSFINMISQYVDKIIVVNPQDFKEICCSSKKTDRIDAKKLANRLKIHIEDNDQEDDFPEVYIPDKDAQRLRRLFSTYEYVNKQIVSVKNKIKSVFRSNLVPVPKMTKYCDLVQEGLKNNLDSVCIFQLKIFAEELNQLKIHKEDIKIEISILGMKRFSDEIQLLMTIPGISDFTACSIMADVVDISRFKNHKKFASYLRSAPRVHSSDTVTHIGKIDKKGRKLTFKYLTQGISHFKRTNPVLKDFYERKCNGKSKGKVRAAIIRKIIVIIYYMLKNNEMYRFSDRAKYLKKIKLFEKKIERAA